MSAVAEDAVVARRPPEPVDYPAFWSWDEDGDQVTGLYRRTEKAPTNGYGKKLLIVLEVGGTERSIWLFHDALLNKFRDELQERKGRRLEVGEQVVIRRLNKKTSANGREYIDYRVLFPDRPQQSEWELFGLDEQSARTDLERPVEPAVDNGDRPPF